MYLLIPEAAEGMNILAQAFTFHNVSINSRYGDISPEADLFTFHNVSINSRNPVQY